MYQSKKLPRPGTFSMTLSLKIKLKVSRVGINEVGSTVPGLPVRSVTQNYQKFRIMFKFYLL